MGFQLPPMFMPMIIMCAFTAGEFMVEVLMRIFIVHSACLLEQKDDVICEVTMASTNSNSKADDMLLYTGLLIYIPQLIISPFVGVWSDRNGRKLLMMFPAGGTVISVAILIGSYATAGTCRSLLIYLSCLVFGLTGRMSVFRVGLSSYISDISTTEQRTKYFIWLSSMDYVGRVSGIFIGTNILQAIGMQYALLAGSICHFVVVFLAIAITETVENSNTNKWLQQSKDIVCTTFKIFSKMDSLLFVNKSKLTGGIFVLILYIILFNYMISRTGENIVLISYVTAPPFYWPSTWYGYLVSLKYAANGMSVLLLANILNMCCHLHETSLMITAFVFKIIAVFALAFSDESWHIYGTIILGSTASMSLAAVRSLLSKEVEPTEYGKIFGVAQLIDTTGKMTGHVGFIIIYEATRRYFAGAVFVVDGILFIIQLALTIWMVLECSRRSKLLESQTQSVDKSSS